VEWEADFVPDRTLPCCDCGQDFVFSEAEQAFFRERGFDHDPKRCVECRRGRRKKFQSRGGGDRTGGATDSERPREAQENGQASRRDRPRPAGGATHSAVCSSCNQETEVPFKPDGVRPVFCMPCLKQQTR